MPIDFQREQGFDEILRDLDQTNVWFAATLGRSVENSRLGQIRAKLDEVIRILDDPARRNSLLEIVKPVEAHHAIVDAAAFNRVAALMRELGPQLVPKELLKRSIDGALSPADETLDENDPRNIFAQLEFAANVARKGLSPTGFDDLRFVHEGFEYHVEVKRPWSESVDAVGRNYRKALSQIEAAILASSASRNRGLVVFSVDRIAGHSAALPNEFKFWDTEDINRGAWFLAGEFFERYREVLVGHPASVVGLGVVSRVLVLSVRTGKMGHAYVPVLKPLCSQGSLDFARLRSLAERMRASTQSA